MGKKKRTPRRSTRRSGLVGRAVSAGRRALHEAENRVPANLRRQVESRLKDADKTARAAIKELQSQVKKASTRADVNTVLKRIDSLTKQARQVAKGSSRRAASTRRRATTKTKRAASTTRRRTTRAASSARRSSPRRSTSRRPASTAKTATARAPRPRRSPSRRSQPAPTMSGMPEVHTVPMAGGGGEMGTTIVSGS